MFSLTVSSSKRVLRVDKKLFKRYIFFLKLKFDKNNRTNKVNRKKKRTVYTT